MMFLTDLHPRPLPFDLSLSTVLSQYYLDNTFSLKHPLCIPPNICTTFQRLSVYLISVLTV